MKSHIDWNEIVPRLPVGLQQTLYLEAVKMVSNGLTRTAEEKREYARRYYHENREVIRRRRNTKTPITGRPRKWTPEKVEEIRAYYKEHGFSGTLAHFKVSSSMLSKWGIKGGATKA